IANRSVTPVIQFVKLGIHADGFDATSFTKDQAGTQPATDEAGWIMTEQEGESGIYSVWLQNMPPDQGIDVEGILKVLNTVDPLADPLFESIVPFGTVSKPCDTADDCDEGECVDGYCSGADFEEILEGSQLPGGLPETAGAPEVIPAGGSIEGAPELPGLLDRLKGGGGGCSCAMCAR
ncbi:MAG: hypothetical protein WC683_17670, partial [bacterium]